jgi:AAA15 family ATPase/GTPase
MTIMARLPPKAFEALPRESRRPLLQHPCARPSRHYGLRRHKGANSKTRHGLFGSGAILTNFLRIIRKNRFTFIQECGHSCRMLIQIKVSNFRSIREEQTLSLVAENADKTLPGNVIERDLPGLKGVRYLKGAALYGANASGKSNVLEAIRFLGQFVERSATELTAGDPTGAEPFKLDHDSASNPSEFEITFVANETRYIFKLGITPRRIVEESLIAYPKKDPQRWYRRLYNNSTKAYNWDRASSHFKLDKALQDMTRENALFLSVGAQFNNARLTKVFDWFKRSLQFIDLGADRDFGPAFTAKLLKDPKYNDRIVRLLKSADFGIMDAKAEEIELDMDKFKEEFPKLYDKIKEILGPPLERKPKYYKPILAHKTEDGSSVPLEYDEEESAGTQQFFSLAGPWLDTLDHGYTVFIDEIETSMHPLMVVELLKLLLNEKTNPKGAQVIFTTHNPILLDQSLMRRDQIWFTEKTPAGATRLYPLTDYKPRNDEALAKGYLAGRYGAIPYLPNGLMP